MKDLQAGFYGELKSILKGVSRTLYLSLNILPEPLRTQLALGYLVARAMDTVADCPAIDAASKREVLGLFRTLEDRAAAGRLAGLVKQAAHSVSDRKEKALLSKFEIISAFYSSLPESDLALQKALVGGVGRGMEMDLDAFPQPAAPGAAQGVRSFGSEEDLKNYCALIGGEPGVFWTRLYRETIRRNNIRPRHLPSEADGTLIGSALQITNILKDMSADLRIGRCYLPQPDLDAAGLGSADLLEPRNMERLRPVVYKWICWAVDQLDLSEKFLASIPKTEPALRAAFIWPVYWAMDTLQEIAKANILEPSDKPKIKRARIYATIAATPSLLLSNTAFARGYRFRRETLIVGISGRRV